MKRQESSWMSSLLEHFEEDGERASVALLLLDSHFEPTEGVFDPSGRQLLFCLIPCPSGKQLLVCLIP